MKSAAMFCRKRSFQLEDAGNADRNAGTRRRAVRVATSQTASDSVFAAAAPQETTIAPLELASVEIRSIAPSIKTTSLHAAISSTAARSPEALEGPVKSYRPRWAVRAYSSGPEELSSCEMLRISTAGEGRSSGRAVMKTVFG